MAKKLVNDHKILSNFLLSVFMLSCLLVTCLHSTTKGAKKRLQRIPNDTFFKHKISQYLSSFILSLLRTALYASNCCTRYILHEAQVPLALKITPESRYVGILTKYYNLNPNSRPKSKIDMKLHGQHIFSLR